MKPWQELVWRLFPGGLMAAIIGAMYGLQLTEPLEQLSYNLLFQLRGHRAWDSRVVVVEIDDPSLKKLGRYPWKRARFTELMQVLQGAERSVVSFDVLFSESTAEDRAFAQAIDAHGQVILAQAVDSNKLPLKPVSLLDIAAIGTGHIVRDTTDGDGVTRRITLNFRGAPALSVLTLQAYGLQHKIPSLPDFNRRLWLNWVGPADKLPSYSFAEVISRRISPQKFQDKIVIVGVSATGFDTLATPFDRNPPVTGTYLHATAVNNLLADNALRRPLSNLPFTLLLFCVMPGFGLGLSYLKVQWQVLITAGLILSLGVVGVVMMHANIYLSIALPMGLIVGTATAVAIIERLRMHQYLQIRLKELSSNYLTEGHLVTPSDAALYPDQTLLLSHATTLSLDISTASHPQKQAWFHGAPWSLWRATAATPTIIERLSLPSSQPASIQTLNQLMRIAAQLGQAQATQQAITQSLSVGLLAINARGTIWFCNELASQWLKVELGDTLDQGLVPLWLDHSTWQHLRQSMIASTRVEQSTQIEQTDFDQTTRARPSDHLTFNPSESEPEAITPLNAKEAQQLTHKTEALVNNRWFSLNFSPLQADMLPDSVALDSSCGLVLLIEDITGQKQIETNLERQIKELQWLTQLKDELIGRVSHELRSPITNMLMSIELLRSTETAEQRRLYLDLLEQECLQEKDFINDLLNLQSPSDQPATRPLTQIQLNSWLERLVAPFTARAKTRQQAIKLEITPNFPEISTDAASLERICQELLTNACKYSPAGATIYCTAQLRSTVAYIAVRNLGVTIAPEELPRIFDKFYRIPEADPWKQGGTGLGLSIIDRLVKQIGATIEVRSESDVTEFELRLPLEVDDAE